MERRKRKSNNRMSSSYIRASFKIGCICSDLRDLRGFSHGPPRFRSAKLPPPPPPKHFAQLRYWVITLSWEYINDNGTVNTVKFILQVRDSVKLSFELTEREIVYNIFLGTHLQLLVSRVKVPVNFRKRRLAKKLLRAVQQNVFSLGNMQL